MGEFTNPKNLPIYSYSKIRSFYCCPYYFFKNYFDKPEDFVPEGHGTSDFGNYVHMILEKYAKGELAEYELYQYYVDNYGKYVRSSFVTQITDDFSKDLWYVYYEGGKKYFAEFTGFGDLEILESEYEFYEEIENSFILHGKVDLICRDKEGKLVIIDHKSKSRFKNKAEKKEYSKQLYLYSHAVHSKYKEFPSTIGFNMFRTNQSIKFKFDYQEYNQTMDWLVRSVNEIENCVEFPAYPGTFYCNNFCTFRAICDVKNNNGV